MAKAFGNTSPGSVTSMTDYSSQEIFLLQLMLPTIRPSHLHGIDVGNCRLLRLRVLHHRYKELCFLVIAKATWPNYWR